MSDSDAEEIEYEPENFIIGGHSLDITTVAYMPLTQLMNNRSKDVEISGQKLWCGSLGVIQYLLNNPTFVNDAIVVELGAGTGVLGMVCKKLNAFNVFLTDHDQKSIEHMTNDILTNKVEASVISLNWYEPDITLIAQAVEACADKPLIVVAGDVLYKRALLEPFLDTVKRILSLRSGAELILCHIPRAGVEQADVVSVAESHGFTVEPIPVDLWNKGDIFQYCPEEDLVRARIYRIRLNM